VRAGAGEVRRLQSLNWARCPFSVTQLEVSEFKSGSEIAGSRGGLDDRAPRVPAPIDCVVSDAWMLDAPYDELKSLFMAGDPHGISHDASPMRRSKSWNLASPRTVSNFGSTLR
jgi:hypothetical protein